MQKIHYFIGVFFFVNILYQIEKYTEYIKFVLVESCHNRVESSKVSVKYLHNIHLQSSWNGSSVFGPQRIPRGLPSEWSYISDIIVALVNFT